MIGDGAAELKLYTIRETAVILSVSRKTIRRLIGSGDLIAYRVGRLWRIRADDLDAFLASRRSR